MMGTVMADADIGFLVYHLSLPMLDLIQLEHFPGYCVMKEIEVLVSEFSYCTISIKEIFLSL